MQNVNKPRGPAECNQQQENNFRTSPTLVTPVSRTEASWYRRPSIIPVQEPSVLRLKNNEHPPNQEMSYHPSDHVQRLRGFRAINHDEGREDRYAIAGRDGVIEWHTSYPVRQNEPAFRTELPYQGIPRASEQFRWRPVTEQQWRRQMHHEVIRESQALPRGHMQVRARPPAAMIYQQSSTWSRTVAQVNNFNQQYQQTRSDRSGFQVNQPHQSSQRDIQPVQGISLSSSTASATSTTSGTSCHSPEVSGTKVGSKRPGETMKESPSSNPSPDDSNGYTKRIKALLPPKPAKFDLLDMLSTVTMEIGPLQENPSGCSCPKSKCIALYCDCFKAGRRCTPGTCSCLTCKNTLEESGINGARTVAIRTILARNPRAFTTAGLGTPLKELSPGQIACNCIRSRCLKLYCGCFQAGSACDPNICTCISCLNTKEDKTGQRQNAIQQCLEKRPNAFQVIPREAGMGCACKNNRCVRKYCECFRNGLGCTEKCTCRRCENMTKDKPGE